MSNASSPFLEELGDAPFRLVLQRALFQRLMRLDVQLAGVPATSSAYVSLIGSSRVRFFVSANTAFATAGAIGGVPGSPIPPGCSLLSTMCTSIFGA